MRVSEKLAYGTLPMERVISFFGLFVMIGLAWLMSSHKRIFPWRVVIGGLLLQLVFGWMILKTDYGKAFFDGVMPSEDLPYATAAQQAAYDKATDEGAVDFAQKVWDTHIQNLLLQNKDYASSTVKIGIVN